MANTIQFKRNPSTGVTPSGLAAGEPAYNIADEILFVGTGSGNTEFRDKVYIDGEISTLKGTPPASLDTLEKLGDAIGDDPSYSATVTSALALKAPIASPTFTGTPTAPTPAASDNSTKIATTAFVLSEIAGAGAYSGWNVSDGSNTETVASTDTVIFTGSDAATVTYATGSNTMTITVPSTLSSYTNDAGYLDSGDIGVSVQAYNANTATYDAVTANFTGTLQEGGTDVLTVDDTIDGGTY